MIDCLEKIPSLQKDIDELQAILRKDDTEFESFMETQKENAVVFDKSREDISPNEKFPITIDVMFHTMLYNQSRIKYSRELVSMLFGEPNDFRLVSAELDKAQYSSKGYRGDFVAIYDKYQLNIEMNNTNTIGRNYDYSNRLYSRGVKKGSKDNKYNRVITLNLLNFTFKGNDKVMEVFTIKNEDGVCLVPVITVNIFIPNIITKFREQEVLTRFEKFIIVMVETDERVAKEVAKGDKIMEDYIRESKEVENDNLFQTSYEYEEEIREQGIERGIEQTVKKLVAKGLTPEVIADYLDIDLNKVLSIRNKESNKTKVLA